MNPEFPTHSLSKVCIVSSFLKCQLFLINRATCTAPCPASSIHRNLIMYLPILALFYLLLPCTSANGCHQSNDNIGCPTVLNTDVFTTAISDFCTNHFQVPSGAPQTVSINVGTSWPGLVYSLPIYEDHWGTQVEFWGTNHPSIAETNPSPPPQPYANRMYVRCTSTANFRVDRTSNGDPYVLDYALCVSLLGQASVGNGTDGSFGPDCEYTQDTSFGGWGNTDFGTVFAEAICPPKVNCLPFKYRPLACWF